MNCICLSPRSTSGKAFPESLVEEFEKKLQRALERDLPEEAEDILKSVENKIEHWQPGASEEELVISKTCLKKYGIGGFSEQMDTVLPQWLSFYGPL